jgi:DNA-binding MarR family transcriptional regulator
VVAGFTGRRITADIRSGGSAESISGAGMRTSGDFGDEAAIADLGPVLQFMRLLWGVDHALQRASKHMARSLGVTGPQRLVIRIIGRSPGISAGLLARILHVHPSTLTGVIERLERHALLRRRHDPTDGRRALLSLTPKGRNFDVAVSGTIEAAVARALRRVPATKLVIVREFMAGLAQALQETRPGSRGRTKTKRSTTRRRAAASRTETSRILRPRRH